MESTGAPVAWIGQRVSVELRDIRPAGVTVEYGGRAVYDTHYGALQAVNEFGLELAEDGSLSGSKDAARFFPWGAIRSLTLQT